jgi:hypothetical protein
MPDNWTFVAAAYALAAAVFGGYWRWLARKERELATLAARNDQAVRTDRGGRSRPLSGSGHPRPEPASRPPLQS